MKMRLYVALLICLTLPLSAISDQVVTGKINGHHCAEAGTACPVDRLDPHVLLEDDFVLQKPDGEYFFLVNIRRDLKVRYVLESVQVSGKINRRYNIITVDEFRIKDGDSWKTVWSPEYQAQSWQHLQSGSEPRN